ncbi:MAG: bifunctional nuclease family protein [Collinsella sp.]
MLLDTVDALGAKLERIEIVRAEPPVFYATIVVLADGDERKIDARPSDAIALAVRSNAPMFVEDDIMNRLGTFLPMPRKLTTSRSSRSSTSSSIRSPLMISKCRHASGEVADGTRVSAEAACHRA